MILVAADLRICVDACACYVSPTAVWHQFVSWTTRISLPAYLPIKTSTTTNPQKSDVTSIGTLHYITLHGMTFRGALHKGIHTCITSHHITLQYTTIHYNV